MITWWQELKRSHPIDLLATIDYSSWDKRRSKSMLSMLSMSILPISDVVLLCIDGALFCVSCSLMFVFGGFSSLLNLVLVLPFYRYYRLFIFWRQGLDFRDRQFENPNDHVNLKMRRASRVTSWCLEPQTRYIPKNVSVMETTENIGGCNMVGIDCWVFPMGGIWPRARFSQGNLPIPGALSNDTHEL